MLTGQMMSRFLTRLYMPIKRKKTEKKEYDPDIRIIAERK